MVPPRWSSHLGWVLFVLASVVAVVGWMRPRELAPPSTGSSSDDAFGTATSPELAALRACADALRSREAADVEVSGVEASVVAADRSADRFADRVAACLHEPAVQQRIADAVARECASSGDGPRAARDADERARAEAARSFLIDELAIAPDEQARLAEYLCAVRDLRGMLARATADGGVPDPYEAVRRERELALSDVETLLGAERYARLRAVGGVAVLSEAAECAAR